MMNLTLVERVFVREKTEMYWLLTLTNEVMWTECNAHLLTFADAPKPRSWPVTVDAGSLEEIIPDLEKAEEERRREEEKLKKLYAYLKRSLMI